MAKRKYSTGGRVPVSDSVPPAAPQAPDESAAESHPSAADNPLLQQLAARQAAEEHQRQEREREQDDPLAAFVNNNPQMSQRQREWVLSHRDAMTDPEKNAYLSAAHHGAIKAGLAVDSDEYFAHLEERLGYRQPAAPPAPAPRNVPMSAPVHREAPSMTGGAVPTRVTLSPLQRQHARISGVSDEEYGRNLIRMLEMKKAGHYSESQ